VLSFKKNFLTQRHEIWSQNTGDSRLIYREHQKSLFQPGFDRYQDMTDRTGQTDRQTDRQTDGQTELR